jgi:hypothetical protein
MRTKAEDVVGIYYHAMCGENTADWEDLAYAVVIYEVYKSVKQLRIPCSCGL